MLQNSRFPKVRGDWRVIQGCDDSLNIPLEHTLDQWCLESVRSSQLNSSFHRKIPHSDLTVFLNILPNLEQHCWKQTGILGSYRTDTNLSLSTKASKVSIVISPTQLNHCFAVCWPRLSHVFVHINVQPRNKGDEGNNDCSNQANSSQGALC